MGYTRADGRYSPTRAITLHASAARTTSGATAAIELGDRGVARLLLDVTAAAGTLPTLDVVVETSFDGSTEWRSIGAFSQKSIVSHERKSFAGVDRFIRATWTIGGTGSPSFTFSLAGEAC